MLGTLTKAGHRAGRTARPCSPPFLFPHLGAARRPARRRAHRAPGSEPPSQYVPRDAVHRRSELCASCGRGSAGPSEPAREAARCSVSRGGSGHGHGARVGDNEPRATRTVRCEPCRSFRDRSRPEPCLLPGRARRAARTGAIRGRQIGLLGSNGNRHAGPDGARPCSNTRPTAPRGSIRLAPGSTIWLSWPTPTRALTPGRVGSTPTTLSHSDVRDSGGFGAQFDFVDPDGIQIEFCYLDQQMMSDAASALRAHRDTTSRH